MLRLFQRQLPLIVLCFFGCGDGRPPLVKATGTVLLDGKPVDGAMVTFQPIVDAKSTMKRPSGAATDSSGKFTLGTYDKADGVPNGKYKVAVQKRDLIGNLPANYDAEKPGNYNLKYQWNTPKKYASFETSGLEVEVTSSGLKPDTLELQSGGAKPEIETTGPQRRGNEP